MNDFDKQHFAQLMVGLGEYYGKQISTAIIGIYWNGLCHYDLVAIREAINRHMRNPDTGQFMPKIADVVKMLDGSTEDAALVAWAAVDGAVRSIGVYSDVDLGDPISHRVIIDMGGWAKFGDKQESEWPFVGKEFQARYRGYKTRGEIPDSPPSLTGIANTYNNSHGYSAESVRALRNAGNPQPLLPRNG